MRLELDFIATVYSESTSSIYLFRLYTLSFNIPVMFVHLHSYLKVNQKVFQLSLTGISM